MIAYIKGNTDFALKGFHEFDKYTFATDIEYADKSQITVLKEPNIANDDFVICKDGNKTEFIGICDTVTGTDETGYTISLKQKECLFDREIFVGTESLISSTGIEDFIKEAVESNWTNSGDALLDKGYISVVASTHTPVSATVDAQNGVYNLKTFLGNAKELYRIYTEFTYTDSAVTIRIYRDTAAASPIDATVSDVYGLEETYTVNVLAKLITKWKDTVNNTVSTLTYYLKADRTLTTNAADPNRAAGVVRSKYVEKATQAEAVQEITNEFLKNSYEHKISFNLLKTGKAYPASQYYVGQKATIKTRRTTQTSIITRKSFSSDSAFVKFEFGKLKITLIDKIREKK